MREKPTPAGRDDGVDPNRFTTVKINAELGGKCKLVLDSGQICPPPYLSLVLSFSDSAASSSDARILLFETSTCGASVAHSEKNKPVPEK